MNLRGGVLLSALTIALVAAGCMEPAAPIASTTPSAPSAASVVSALSPCPPPQGCWEPAIAVDSARNVFVAIAHSSVMAVSRDQGKTYETIPTPPLPPGAPPGLGQYDGTVAIGPGDRLYYYAFLATASALSVAASPSPPVALQVASSIDAARTWETNALLSPVNGPEHPVVSPWKSWMGFAPDGTAYIDYNSRGSGIWSARSDDEGRTWGTFTRVTPTDDRIISVFMGGPVVDSRDRVLIPYFGDQSPNENQPFMSKGHELRVAISEDRGVTYSHQVVDSVLPPGYVGTMFPVIAIDEEDRMVLAHLDSEGQMVIRASHDQGATWQPPVAWSGTDTGVSPWATLRDGVVSLMYYSGDGMVLARGAFSDPLGEPFEKSVLDSAATGNGDFMHFTLDPMGAVVVPVPSPAEDALLVATVPAWDAS